MPTTRSKARSMRRHNQPAIVPPESPFAAISTAAINQSSSLFNSQVSTSQPGMFRPEDQPTPSTGQTGSSSLFGNWTPTQQPTPWPGQTGSSSLFGNWTPSQQPTPSTAQTASTSLFGNWTPSQQPSQQLSQNNAWPLFGRNESIQSPITENRNPPLLFAKSENQHPLFGSKYPQVGDPFKCYPPNPHAPVIFGIRIKCKPGCVHYASSQEAERAKQPLPDNSLLPEEYAEARQERIDKVNEILERVNCLDDLTEDVVRELMATDYGLLPIMKFKACPSEYFAK